jgi:tetratricopeptide repeat protein 8
MTLAYQAFRLALSNNNDHAEAYNNLGVLEMRKGHVDMVSLWSKFLAPDKG